MNDYENNLGKAYLFNSAKKIYFNRTDSKIILFEKKDDKNKLNVFSLLSRNPILLSRENGMLLFPRSR